MPNYNNKKYYDSKSIDSIMTSISNCDYNTAIRLADEYIEKYPNDIIVHLLKARALVFLGELRTGVRLAKDWYLTESFHNDSLYIYASDLYCNVLKDANVEDEANRTYLSVINKYENSVPTDKLLRFVNSYLGFLLTNRRFMDVLNFVNNHSYYDTDEIKLKKAQALVQVNKPEVAIRILNTIDSPDSMILHKNFTYGFAYFRLAAINHYRVDYLEKAEYYYLKSLNKKNYHYYHACFDLANIYKRMGKLDKAIEYVEYTRNCFNSIHLDDKFKNEVLTLEFSVYLLAQNLKKCEDIVNEIDNKYLKIREKTRLLFAMGEYKKCIEEADNIIENGYWDESNQNELDTILYNKVCSHIRLKEYEKAKESLSIKKNFSRENDVLSSIIDINMNNVDNKDMGFLPNQIINYNREQVIEHILECAKANCHSGFRNKKDIERAINYGEPLLNNTQCIHEGLLDEYHIATKDFNLVNQDPGDTLVVKTLADTYKVINAYPIIKSHKDKYHEVVQKEIKRESQIEKFNRRYGTR